MSRGSVGLQTKICNERSMLRNLRREAVLIIGQKKFVHHETYLINFNEHYRRYLIKPKKIKLNAF